MKFFQARFKYWQSKISEKRERASKMTHLMHRRRSNLDCSQSHLKPSHNCSSFRWVFQQCIFQAWDHASIAFILSKPLVHEFVQYWQDGESAWLCRRRKWFRFLSIISRKSYIIAGLRWFFQQCFSLWVEMMLPELHLVKIVVCEFVQILSRWWITCTEAEAIQISYNQIWSLFT